MQMSSSLVQVGGIWRGIYTMNPTIGRGLRGGHWSDQAQM
jgi:hypothetical protein